LCKQGQWPSLGVPASAERGKHLAAILCMECHADDLGGTFTWFQGAPIGVADAPNLTTGQGGLGGLLTAMDFVRVLRHGVKPDGTSVFIVPAEHFHHIGDEGLGDNITYIRGAPPVGRQTPQLRVRLSLLGNVMYGAVLFGNLLRHRWQGCPGLRTMPGGHQRLPRLPRSGFAGGKPRDPASPNAPRLTPGCILQRYRKDGFVTALRIGVTLFGVDLPSRFMPWDCKGQMIGHELEAVWAQLRSLPALRTSTASAEQ
jgi:hypothetical protein